jgi:hypothetical protein
MASLRDAEQLAQNLEELVGRLRKEIQDGGDFENLVSISDEISEQADGLAETFSNLNDTLVERLRGVKSNSGSRRAKTDTGAKAATGS